MALEYDNYFLAMLSWTAQMYWLISVVEFEFSMLKLVLDLEAMVHGLRCQTFCLQLWETSSLIRNVLTRRREYGTYLATNHYTFPGFPFILIKTSSLAFWTGVLTLETNVSLMVSLQALLVILSGFWSHEPKPSILLNIMFHALMGRFQLELFIFITYFSTVIPLTSCVFFPAGLSSLTRHFQQV